MPLSPSRNQLAPGRGALAKAQKNRRLGEEEAMGGKAIKNFVLPFDFLPFFLYPSNASLRTTATLAIARQCPGEELMAHSDRGMQYASEHYQRLLKEHGITCPMSRKGNGYDNAPMKSFFATLKKKLVCHEQYQPRAEARASLFEYIEEFYNRIRRHSALNNQTPAQFAEAA